MLLYAKECLNKPISRKKPEISNYDFLTVHNQKRL